MAELEEKYNKSRKASWAQLWGRGATINYYGFTPDMFAEELRICHGADKEAFSAGTIRDWAADMGKLVKPLYSWAAPECELSRKAHAEEEERFYAGVARAAFRIAALMNEATK